MVGDYAIRGKQASKRQLDVETKLRLISDPGSAVLVVSNSSFKTSGGTIKRTLQTSIPERDVESHYREELQTNGWFYVRENTILSHRRLLFCNYEEEAFTLVLPKDEPREGFKYSVIISWANSNGCR